MNCDHCGANLTLDDMTRPNCPYCQNVLKHHARAAEHAVLINRMMDDRIRGMYPGMDPNDVPKVGHQFGAPMDPSFGRFQIAQTQKAMQGAAKTAMWITVLAFVVPVLLVVAMGVGIAVWLFVAV